MLAKFLKRKTQLTAALSAVFVVPFLLFPFYHFHPDNTHGHAGQLQSHVHQGHFHSEVMEGLAHLAQSHPADSEQGQLFHQSHSLPEHDSDDSQFYVYYTDVSPVKTNFVSKPFVDSTLFAIPQPLIFYSSTFEISNLPDRHSQRSPLLLI